jgi:hypothetical protein
MSIGADPLRAGGSSHGWACPLAFTHLLELRQPRHAAAVCEFWRRMHRPAARLGEGK